MNLDAYTTRILTTILSYEYDPKSKLIYYRGKCHSVGSPFRRHLKAAITEKWVEATLDEEDALKKKKGESAVDTSSSVDEDVLEKDIEPGPEEVVTPRMKIKSERWLKSYIKRRDRVKRRARKGKLTRFKQIQYCYSGIPLRYPDVEELVLKKPDVALFMSDVEHELIEVVIIEIVCFGGFKDLESLAYTYLRYGFTSKVFVLESI